MRIFGFLALTMLAFAANSVLNRLAVGSGAMDAVSFALVRVLSGAVVLALLVLWQSGGLPRVRGRWPGVLALTTYLLGFSLAYRGIDAGAGALILFGLVQLTMFGAALWVGEAVPRSRWVGAGLAFAGLALLLWPGAEARISLTHALLMAGAGIGWGVFSLIGRGESDALGATAASFLGAAPLIGAIWLVAAGPGAEAIGIGLAAVAGAVTSGLGYALWYHILPGLGRTRAAAAQLTVPVLAALGGALWLAEPLGWRFGIAALLVLGGVALALRSAATGDGSQK